MKGIRRALLDGAMVIVPLGAIILLVLGIIHRLQDAAAPLAEHYVHPAIAAVALLVLLCLLVGFLVRSTAGYRARQALEAMIFERVPGYRLVKAFAGEGPLAAHEGRAMRPALAAIEDGLCPPLVMDEFADGRLLVFVPGAPAPMSGAIYVFTPDKVTYLEVPLLRFLKTISSWGLGLPELLEKNGGIGGRPLPPSR
jgi:uncharacterized membrane protein